MITRTKEWLLIKRSQLGMTQKEFANMCELTLSTIQNIEQGKRLGSSETWDKIEYSLKYIGENSLILNDSSDILIRLKRLLSIYDNTHPVCVFYEFNEKNIVFTDFALLEQFNKLKDTYYKDKKYMKTSLLETLEIFEFQNKRNN